MRARGSGGRGRGGRGSGGRGRGRGPTPAPLAATSFPGFATTVAALAIFNTHLQGSEDALLAERERLVQRHMQSVGPPPTDFDPERLRLCETMMREAAACESFAAVRALPTFAAFEASFAVPSRLVQLEDLRALTGYLASVARGASEAAAEERATRLALDEVRSSWLREGGTSRDTEPTHVPCGGCHRPGPLPRQRGPIVRPSERFTTVADQTRGVAWRSVA